MLFERLADRWPATRSSTAPALGRTVQEEVEDGHLLLQAEQLFLQLRCTGVLKLLVYVFQGAFCLNLLS